MRTDITYMYMYMHSTCIYMYLSFDVSVQNFSVVNMLESQADLDKPVENLWTRRHDVNHTLTHSLSLTHTHKLALLAEDGLSVH